MAQANRKNKSDKDSRLLRRGWTTGACATAATKSALAALITGEFTDPVEIELPKGDKPSFFLAKQQLEHDWASASIIKDAGDDPDVTHGALVTSTVRFGANSSGTTFKAGEGVGVVTKPGLPLPVGEPAINPVPRELMSGVVQNLCKMHNVSPDIEITISVADGENLAKQTWNPRLGILGGISILGTTGVVHPFSCSAWIHSIHRGIDVCRANNIDHALAATGSTSEDAAKELYNFPDEAVLDMGDFAGGLLKYLRRNPIPRITIAGGFAKLSKLANGSMDLHSGRSQVDMDWLASLATKAGLHGDKCDLITKANTALEALQICESNGIDLANVIAGGARTAALEILRDAPVEVETIVVSRAGKLLARSSF